MAGETVITLVGNLTADPELTHTPNGYAVSNFTIASTPRTFDRQSNDWKDGETLYLRCSVWRDFAENVARSLTKGMRVVATGRLKQRSFETKEGEKRTVVELDIDEIGPSLRYATAQVARSESRGQSGFGAGQPVAQGEWSRPAVAGGDNHRGASADGFGAQGANQGNDGRFGGPASGNPWGSPAGAGGSSRSDGGMDADFGDEQPF